MTAGRRFLIFSLVGVNVLVLGVMALKPKSVVARGQELREEALEPRFERLKPLHAPKTPPGEHDWLAQHQEPGQSVEEYLKSQPVRPGPDRSTLYLQPIGDFSPTQRDVLARTQDFLGRFYGLKVQSLEPLPLSAIPESARRSNPLEGQPQILTTYLIREVLAPRRPADAVAVLALTAEDLFPDPSWNFVFGQASSEDRVGVWSLYRNGDPSESPEAFRRCLARTILTAVHETGHMLGLSHCIAYECLMNGSNHREEADARPLEPCPACLRKLCWNVGCDPVARFERLAAFAKENGLDASYYEKARALVAAP